MKRSKIIIVCLFLMSIFSMLHAQDTIRYQYDAAGNRISRTIVLQTKSAPAPAEEKQTAVYTEVLSDITIKIYPNPTDGLLKVEISNLPKGQAANIWLFSVSGKLISSYKKVSNPVSIDISAQPAGIYVMKIEAGKRLSEWKIIKK